ncbi:MAG: hypothetical protein HQL82_10530 [Magnetococcales bacterium]|nr:hypothetical protein [Magnetococcales bacterium]
MDKKRDKESAQELGSNHNKQIDPQNITFPFFGPREVSKEDTGIILEEKQKTAASEKEYEEFISIWRTIADLFPSTVSEVLKKDSVESKHSSVMQRLFGEELRRWMGIRMGMTSLHLRMPATEGQTVNREQYPDDNEQASQQGTTQQLLTATTDIQQKTLDQMDTTAPPAAPSEGPVFTALEGDKAMVMLQSRAGAQRLYSAPEKLINFIANSVAPAIARLEANRMASPEELVDIILEPLAGRRFPDTPLADCAGVSGLVAGLRGFLENQEDNARGSGYYTSRGALPQWLSKLDDGAIGCRHRAVFYYHELVSLGPNTLQDINLFGRTTNNLTTTLADFWQNKPDAPQGQLLSRLQALATAAQMHGRQRNDMDEARLADQLLQSMGMRAEAGQAAAIVHALMVAANVPASWRVVAPEVLGGMEARHDEEGMALISCASGVVRMAFNPLRDWDEIPSALFNAGVSLVRKGKSAAVNVDARRRLLPARVACNATGLVWALARGKDWVEALAHFHGMDCAVNLFGALAEWQGDRSLQAARECMVRLANGLAAIGSKLGQRQQVEYVRLKGSWDQLNIEVQPAGRTQEELLDDLDELLKELQIDFPGHGKFTEQAETEWMVQVGNMLAEQLTFAFGTEYYQELTSSLLTLLRALVQHSTDIEKAWQELYGEMAEPVLDRTRTADDIRDHSGPLVKLGEMSRTEWIRVAEQSMETSLIAPTGEEKKPQPRLGPWLMKYLNYSAKPAAETTSGPDPTTLTTPQRPRRPPPFAPLEGDKSMVMLQTRAYAQQLYSDPGRLMDFFAHAVAPAIGRLENNRLGTPEELVDILLGALAGRRFPGTVLGDCSGVSNLLAGLRGILETQNKNERSAGYYTSRGAVGQWLNQVDDGALGCRRRAVFYYHEMLSLGPIALQDVNLFGMVANNMVGTLANYWRDRPNELQGQLLSRLQALAVAGQLHGQKGHDPDKDSMAGSLFKALGMEASQQAFDVARALMVVANVPSSWLNVAPEVLGREKEARHGEDWMALMSCSASLVRMAFNQPKDWDDISASLFNAGVALARERQSAMAGAGRQAIVAAQVALNATGLVWALARGKDWEQILATLNGLDCAVNLFGTLANWQQAPVLNTARNTMTRLASGLLGVSANLAQRQQAEFVRLQGSWDQLGIAPRAIIRSPQDLLNDLDELLKTLKIAFPGHAGLMGDDKAYMQWMVGVGTMLSGLLESVYGADKYRELADDLLGLLNALVRHSSDLETAWRKLYGEIAEIAEPNPEKGEEIRNHSGPLVMMGDMTRAEWVELAATAIDQSLANGERRFGPWLAEFFSQ